MLSPVFLTSAGSACPSGRATRTPVSFSSSIEYGNNMHMHRHPLTHKNESTTRGRLVLASHYPNTRAPPTGFSPQATLRPLSRSSRGSCFRKTTVFSKKQLPRPLRDRLSMCGWESELSMCGWESELSMCGWESDLQCVVGISYTTKHREMLNNYFSGALTLLSMCGWESELVALTLLSMCGWESDSQCVVGP